MNALLWLVYGYLLDTQVDSEHLLDSQPDFLAIGTW